MSDRSEQVGKRFPSRVSRLAEAEWAVVTDVRNAHAVAAFVGKFSIRCAWIRT